MRPARATAIVLLSFLGISAVAGAIPMMLHPGGSAMVPLGLLEHSPFHSFLIPGMLLLAANGLLSLVVLGLVLMRSMRHGLWTALQGCVLLGWLVVECCMLRTVVWLHWLYAAVALALIVSGLALRRPHSYG
jgi:hypothetical protein